MLNRVVRARMRGERGLDEVSAASEAVKTWITPPTASQQNVKKVQGNSRAATAGRRTHKSDLGAGVWRRRAGG
jgi:hypothetical protein